MTCGCGNKIFCRHLAAYTMPQQTERQQAADALQRAFLVNLMTEHEEDLLDFNSDSSSDNSTNSSSDDLDNEPFPAVSEMLLETLGNLYSQRYLKERTQINKSGENLKLLLTDWKVS
jgi:hypothetical protein